MRWIAGDRVADRFVLVGRLAAGGMAEVHVAEMTAARGVHRRVALKRIHPHLVEDPEFTAMFLEEARIAGQLVHPKLVPVLDAVEWQGELLLVLDYVPGWDLGEVLRAARLSAQPVPVGVAVRIAQELAEALAHVHDASGPDGRPLGIVHRDVTPSNVLLAHDGSVRLLDFGVAKARERAVRTITQGLKGKVAYMAPEQAKAGAVDPRTDLYALGLVLFEMLVGHRALDAESDVALLDLARAPAIPPISTLRPEVPAALEALVAHLLVVEPGDRPAHATDVVHALEGTRAALGGISGADVRAFVTSVMGCDARPVDDGRARLDAALAQSAGVTLGAAGTALMRGAPGTRATSPTPLPDVRHPNLHPPGDDPPPQAGAPSLRGHHESGRNMFLVAGGLLVVAGAAALAWGSWGGSLLTGQAPATGAVEPGPAAPSDAKPGFLRVTSTPSGARVTLDDVALGDTTPTVIESPGGRDRKLVVSLDDHEPWTQRVATIAGRTSSVHATLPLRKGRLVVRSTPAGAEVRVAGQPAGNTPTTVTDLPRVTTRVRVTLAGHSPYETVVPFDTQAEATIDAPLVRRVATGTLDVSSTPWAEVWEGGRRLAESTPALGLRLAAGDHTVTLTNPRLGLRAQRRVTIREGARASLVVHLR